MGDKSPSDKGWLICYLNCPKKQDEYWKITQELVNQGQWLKNEWRSSFFRKNKAKTDLPKWKKHYNWLKEAGSIAWQAVLENVGDAYDRYYRRQNKEPKFKSKRRIKCKRCKSRPLPAELT